MVRQDDDCAAFSSAYFVNLNEGDQVPAELDKVGSMVMLDEERNAAFEVFAHTGRSCLIEYLMLIEDLLAAAAPEEKALLMFYGESEYAGLF